jgi:hypothetical protein
MSRWKAGAKFLVQRCRRWLLPRHIAIDTALVWTSL